MFLKLSRCHQFRQLSECAYKTPSKIKNDCFPIPVYGGRRTVTLLPGSGIGPEMTTHIQDIFATAKVPIDFEVVEGFGEKLVEHAVFSLTRNRVGLKGNLENVLDSNSFVAPNVLIRALLDMYVVVTHYKAYPELKSKFPTLDLVLIRQNTEGEYAMLEHESVKGMVESLKIITRKNTKRLAKFAFDYAKKHNREKITVVHNARELELSDGLFLNTIQAESKSYPEITFKDVNIDHCCSKIIQNPHVYDILLLPNLYGAIMANIICGLSGGNGLYSATNYGDNLAIFETATRQTGQALKGKNAANPTAMINASILMLKYLGKNNHAQIINDAVDYTLIDKRLKTKDLDGTNSTLDIVNSVKEFISKHLKKYRIF